ncbi:MAG: DNA polymerase Y family protein [Candidatus Binatia bacterium]
MRSFIVVPLACVDLPAFPLQLLLRRHPDWVRYPAAVVAEDKPQGLILWVNEKARRHGVLPGLRYAAALSLAAGLHADKVSSHEIHGAVKELTQRLLRFTPEVEPAAEEPGVFWLNGMGLKLLYASSEKWARALHVNIAAQKFQVSVAVGFTRFGTYAVAKVKEGITVFHNSAEERQTAEKVPLHRLDLDLDFRDMLFKLGIKTVGALLSLPPVGLRERFGPKAYRLHRMAAGELWTPLDPCKSEEPVRQQRILDDPENDTMRLIFLIKQLLHPMLATLAARAQVLTALRLSFLVDRSEWLKEPIRPAVPTLDSSQILDLVRLRLESLQFPAGVAQLALEAEACPATAEQLRLFSKELNGSEGP